MPKLEPSSRDGVKGSDETQEGDKRNYHISDTVSITIISHRSRFCDADNLASKWFIDSLVRCEIIGDDSPVFVDSVTFKQIKCRRSEEKTVIEIYKAKP